MTTKTKILVIYHGNCADGFTSAWVAKNYFASHRNVLDITYLAGFYGEPPPDVSPYKRVFLLDFSYKRPVLLELATKNPLVQFEIIDHHKTAQEDLVALPDNVHTIFDMNESGASLAHKFFFPDHAMPDIVTLVKDRDLWKFDDPRSKPFAAGLFARNYTFEDWYEASDNVEKVVEEGEAILKKHFKDIEELMPKTCTRLVLYDGEQSYVVNGYNLPYTLSSDVGNIAAEKSSNPFGCCYWIDGEYVQFSLRSIDSKVDVSKIAKYYGGGGHRNAAGFKVDVNKFCVNMLVAFDLEKED